MAQEIGRQAQIFKKAKKVYVWLNQSSREGIVKAMDNIPQAAAMAGGDFTNINPTNEHHWEKLHGSRTLGSLHAFKSWLTSKAARLKVNSQLPMISPASNGYSTLSSNEAWLDLAITNLKSLTADRWFSSLWTLQEAFLCQWAYLISGEIEEIYSDSPQLHSVFHACKTLKGICKSRVAEKKSHDDYVTSPELQLIELIERNGLGALEAENPMALYTVASNRVTSRSEDRTYGIMQVFGFQLEISASDAKSLAIVDLLQLELQLGQQLIKQYSLMSQLHVHIKSTIASQAWRVSINSRVLELVFKLDIRVARVTMGRKISLCSLSFQEVAGCFWDSFSGNLCAFEKLGNACGR
ncbi:MAG: hypothetical protein Q9195_008550 [Heterodermia aff. obscurata]